MKWLAIVCAVCIFLTIFNIRYLVPEAGVSTRSPDYATHISIEQHLKNGLLFPEAGKTEKGLHAVSKYLPVYHGLLGFHVSALGLELFGIPLPGAYQLIMDLCLGIYIFFFCFLLHSEWKKERRWEYLFATLTFGSIFLSHFARAVDEGFFSQIMSYAILLMAWLAWENHHRKLSWILIAFAGITYPDFLVWVLPVLVFEKRIRIVLFVRIGLSIAWALLIYTLFTRRNLPGPAAVSLYPLWFLPLLLLVFGQKLYNERRNFFFCLTSYTLVTLGFLLASQKDFTWGYYALKLAFPASFFLIYAFLTMPLLRSRGGRTFVLIYIFFFWGFSDSQPSAIHRYFSRNEVLNNKFYQSILATKETLEETHGQCFPQNTLILPFEKDIPRNKEGMLGLWARNSTLLNSDISSGYFKDAAFKTIYGRFLDFEKSYWDGVTPGNTRLFLMLEQLPPKHDICIVSPATERSLFNGNPCFVILKEQGGQIYAQCKASVQL